ncbi:hypothetical protein ACL02T_32245 [Pseudonocardia sp. RS010]|uniref:hypothetical protein n=1 Tax=Pseudonocardia sp. RS010 TaxID=3385979 RepID=UPI0039A1820C
MPVVPVVAPDDLADFHPGRWPSRRAWADARDAYAAEHGRGSRHDLIPEWRRMLYDARLALWRCDDEWWLPSP